MKRTRRKFSAEFKTKIVLEALSKPSRIKSKTQEAEQLNKTIGQQKIGNAIF